MRNSNIFHIEIERILKENVDHGKFNNFNKSKSRAYMGLKILHTLINIIKFIHIKLTYIKINLTSINP